MQNLLNNTPPSNNTSTTSLANRATEVHRDRTLLPPSTDEDGASQSKTSQSKCCSCFNAFFAKNEKEKID
jgi:hypothetical protein